MTHMDVVSEYTMHCRICIKSCEMTFGMTSTHVKAAKYPCTDSQSFPAKTIAHSPITASRQDLPRRFAFGTIILKVIESADAFRRRGCVEPLLFPFYIRSVFGVKGSTIVRLLPLIEYGLQRCSSSFIRRTSNWTYDNVPDRRLSMSGYGAVAIQRDNFSTFSISFVTSVLLRLIRTALISKVKRKRSSLHPFRIFSNITSSLKTCNNVSRPISFSIGNNFVGVNGFFLVNGPRSRRQRSSCSRRHFPICVGDRSISRGLLVVGPLSTNVW